MAKTLLDWEIAVHIDPNAIKKVPKTESSCIGICPSSNENRRIM